MEEGSTDSEDSGVAVACGVALGLGVAVTLEVALGVDVDWDCILTSDEVLLLVLPLEVLAEVVPSANSPVLEVSLPLLVMLIISMSCAATSSIYGFK